MLNAIRGQLDLLVVNWCFKSGLLQRMGTKAFCRYRSQSKISVKSFLSEQVRYEYISMYNHFAYTIKTP